MEIPKKKTSKDVELGYGGWSVWNDCHSQFTGAMIDRLEDMFANAINGVVLFEDVSKLIQELEECNGE